MPSLKQIKKTMEDLKVDAEVMQQINFEADTSDNNPRPVIEAINKLDVLLTQEQRFQIMERQGCSKSGIRDKACKDFGKTHAGKTLKEKVEALKIERLTNLGLYYIFPPQINDDGSLTIRWGGHQNGVHTGKTTCSCPAIKKLPQPFNISSTYCGCCAGHFLYHYQNAFGIKLQLKKILSSPLNTAGEKPCSFIYEIIE